MLGWQLKSQGHPARGGWRDKVFMFNISERISQYRSYQQPARVYAEMESCFTSSCAFPEKVHIFAINPRVMVGGKIHSSWVTYPWIYSLLNGAKPLKLPSCEHSIPWYSSFLILFAHFWWSSHVRSKLLMIESHILVFIFCFLLVKLPRLLVKSQFLLAQSPFLLMTSPFSYGFHHFPRWTKHLQRVSRATRQVSRVSPGAIACITCQCGGALHQKLW
jgi:hypothetical protein